MTVALAWGQLRRRPAGFAGPAAALLLAVAAVTAVGALLGSERGLPAAERRPGDGPGVTLIAGAFGEITVLVAFFLALHTLGLALRHQGRDLALLRTVAATPRQVRRLLRTQSALVVLAVAAPGGLLGTAAARAFLDGLRRRGLAAPHARITGTAPTTAAATAVALLLATAAATAAARRITRPAPAAALTAHTGAEPRPGPVRLLTAAAALTGGVLLLRLAATRPAAEVDKSAQATLLGTLALLAATALAGPLLVRPAGAPLGALLRAAAPGTGWLADTNRRGHAHRLAAAVVPIALLTGLSATTATMTATARHAARTTGTANGATSGTDSWLRQTELGLLAGFAAIAVLTTLVALTAERRREFALLRMVGATRPHVLRAVAVETVLTSAVGLLLGALVTAAATTAFSTATTGTPLPVVPLATCARIAAAALLLTVPVTLAATAVALRGPATAAAGGERG
ncbi:FtsX-like permease family protein [Kitasatospora sp. NPDC088391]|uniref:FtsX-like permease family protein n=1 Tax=Kitasatospora sp. NPDC088391 TaxID=3364074 RepID=UPI003818E873